MPNEPEYAIPVSSRLLRLPPYLFGQINATKLRKRREGVDIIDLGMGNPSDPTPRPIVEKLCEAARDARNQRYSVSVGIYNLRREIARRWASHRGVELDPESEVIVTVGSKEGFSHTCLALLNAGDTAVVPDPAFPIHVYGVVLADANVISVRLGNDEEFLKRIAYVVEHLYPRPKLLILNYPNNPTTMCVGDVGFFEEVVALAKRFGFMVIHDFAYGDTCFGAYRAPSFLEAPGARDVGVEFGTLSKAYNMAGWRIGYAVGNADIIRALAKVKGYYDYGVFQAIQIASIVALRHCDADALHQTRVYQRRRDALVKGLHRIGWTGTENPKAGMFVWAKVPEEVLAGRGTIEFSLDLMEKANVAVAPGRAFGPNGEGYLRLALVENEQRLNQAVRQIGRALK
jgi:alanine-synthesizing transaminase